jgi:transcriptional/translational regulatory protein YebC/TACO1
VAYLFSQAGVLSYPAEADEDQVIEVALEAGAEDVVNNDDGSFDVLTAPEHFSTVKDAVVGAGLEPDQAEVTMRASTNNVLAESDAEKMLRLLDALEDLDDVQNVYSNAEIPDEILEALG